MIILIKRMLQKKWKNTFQNYLDYIVKLKENIEKTYDSQIGLSAQNDKEFFDLKVSIYNLEQLYKLCNSSSI